MKDKLTNYILPGLLCVLVPIFAWLCVDVYGQPKVETQVSYVIDYQPAEKVTVPNTPQVNTEVPTFDNNQVTATVEKTKTVQKKDKKETTQLLLSDEGWVITPNDNYLVNYAYVKPEPKEKTISGVHNAGLTAEQRIIAERIQASNLDQLNVEVEEPAKTYNGEFKNMNFGIAYNFLVKKGLTPVQASAIVANMLGESGASGLTKLRADVDIKTTARGVTSSDTYQGICQWNSYNWSAFSTYCSEKDLDVYDIYAQLNFLWDTMTGKVVVGSINRYECLVDPPAFAEKVGMQNAKKGLPDNFFTATDLEEAVKAFELCYEGAISKSSESGLQGYEERCFYALLCYEEFCK